MIQDNGKKHELESWDVLRKKYESVLELGYDLSTPERIETTRQQWKGRRNNLSRCIAS